MFTTLHVKVLNQDLTWSVSSMITVLGMWATTKPAFRLMFVGLSHVCYGRSALASSFMAAGDKYQNASTGNCLELHSFTKSPNLCMIIFIYHRRTLCCYQRSQRTVPTGSWTLYVLPKLWELKQMEKLSGEQKHNQQLIRSLLQCLFIHKYNGCPLLQVIKYFRASS